MTDTKWIIWSFEHKAWWMPLSRGYTEKVENAGKYSYEEAVKIVTSANAYGRINEAMLPEVSNVRTAPDNNSDTAI